MSKPASKKPHPAATICEVGDHVFADHPKHGAMAVKIVSKGKDGFYGKGDDGKRHALAWDAVRGHKARKLERYSIIDRGADGALVEDARGRRRFIAGELPGPPPPEPAPKMDDPLTGGLDRLSKASAMTLPDGTMLLFKSTIANRPGLTLEKITDRAGHTTQRWKRSNPDQEKERREPRLDPSKPAPLQRATPDVRANPADRWKTSDPSAPASPAPRREPTLPKPAPAEKGGEKRALLSAKPGDKIAPKPRPDEGKVAAAPRQSEGAPSNEPPMEDAPKFKNDGPAVDPEKAKLAGGRKDWSAEPEMKHGDTVAFRHGEVQGTGKIVASGKDGVTVHDGEREHQVRHEALEGKAPTEHEKAEPKPSAPKRKKAASDSTGLVSGFSNMASAISDNLREALWTKLQAGDTTEAGRPSAVLIAAKAVQDAGQIKDRAGFDDFVKHFYEAMKQATAARTTKPLAKALLFFKAQVQDDAGTQKFAVPVQVEGYTTKGGVAVKPHTAIRHKAEAPADHAERHAAGQAAYKQAYTEQGAKESEQVVDPGPLQEDDELGRTKRFAELFESALDPERAPAA